MKGIPEPRSIDMTNHKQHHNNHNNHSHRHHQDIDLYDDIEKIKAALMEASQDVKGKAAELLVESVDSMKDKTKDMTDDLANYTAKKPLKSLGIALLVGVSIGYLLRK